MTRGGLPFGPDPGNFKPGSRPFPTFDRTLGSCRCRPSQKSLVGETKNVFPFDSGSPTLTPALQRVKDRV